MDAMRGGTRPMTRQSQIAIPGGMCRTLSFGDFHFDLGDHRFHDRDVRLTREIKELLDYAYPIMDIGHEAKLDRIMKYPDSFEKWRVFRCPVRNDKARRPGFLRGICAEEVEDGVNGTFHAQTA
jgi:hypothetical protein